MNYGGFQSHKQLEVQRPSRIQANLSSALSSQLGALRKCASGSRQLLLQPSSLSSAIRRADVAKTAGKETKHTDDQGRTPVSSAMRASVEVGATSPIPLMLQGTFSTTQSERRRYATLENETDPQEMIDIRTPDSPLGVILRSSKGIK